MTFLKHVSSILAAVMLSITGSAYSYDEMSPNVQIVVTYTDPANYGFNDPGLGTARKTALEYALSLWANQLKGTVPIQVEAECQSLGGTANSAVLASAGPLSAAYATDPWVPHINTYYPLNLLNQYGDQDFNESVNDIQVTVNVDVDNSTVLGNTNFYYGTDENPGPSHIDFVTVLLHELGHGFGVLTFMNQHGAMLNNRPDVYLQNLVQQPGGSLVSMTNAGRKSAAISNALYWDGNSLKNRNNAIVDAPYGNVKMYAPGTYQAGSSVSHFDLSNDPNLLMEPSYTGAAHGLDVTGNLLRDIGWYLEPTALPVALTHFSIE